MGRFLVMEGVGSAISEADLMQQHKGSGLIFTLGMIVMSVSIISLIMFACADRADKPRKVDKQRKIKEKPRKIGNRGGVYSGGTGGVYYGVVLPGTGAYNSACVGSSTDGGGGCACGGSGGGGGC